MKKLVVLTIGVALFIGIPFCVFAQEERRDATSLCKALDVSYAPFAKNLGQCVSFIQTCAEESGHSQEWCACRLIRIVNDPEAYQMAFKNQGLASCIAVLRDTHY
jgi:hypothetical protein